MFWRPLDVVLGDRCHCPPLAPPLLFFLSKSSTRVLSCYLTNEQYLRNCDKVNFEFSAEYGRSQSWENDFQVSLELSFVWFPSFELVLEIEEVVLSSISRTNFGCLVFSDIVVNSWTNDIRPGAGGLFLWKL